MLGLFDMDGLMTVEELSKLLKVKKSTIYKWTHEEYIPHVKMGRLVRFNPKEIGEWVEKKKIAVRLRRYPRTRI